MLLVDSSVWIDFFNGKSTPQTDFLHTSLKQPEVVLGDLVLYEVLRGFKQQRDFDKARNLLMKLPVLNMGGVTVALRAADNYRYLRQRGVTIQPTVDCIIATFAIVEGYTLLHSDKDFIPFAEFLGLAVAL